MTFALHRIPLVASLLFFASALNAQTAGTVSTYAGVPPLAQNGTQATTQVLGELHSVVADGAGGFYVSSLGHHRVYRVSQTGVLTVIAGDGSNSFSGDGSTATLASLNGPSGLALDAAGNLFIADAGNHRIRKVTPGGIISTVAGNGTASFSGDGGAATLAGLLGPSGVAVDTAGNTFIADSGNNRIRRVTPGGTVSTVAGSGAVTFGGDGGPAVAAGLSAADIAVDEQGNLFISDPSNGRVRRVSAAGIISTAAGSGSLSGISSGGVNGSVGGPATAALVSPLGLALDSGGSIFIAQRDSVKKVTLGVVSTVAGYPYTSGFTGDGGPATSALINAANDVAADAAGNLFIAQGDGRIRRVTAAGVISTVAGRASTAGGFSGDSGSAIAAELRRPGGLAMDGQGNLLMADTGNFSIRRVTPAGIITTIAGRGPSFGFQGDGGPAASARLANPNAVAADAAGNLFIADTINFRIRKVTTSGIISTIAGTGAPGFSGDGGPAAAASLGNVTALTVDANGNLYFADPENNRVRRVTPAGTISTIAGNGSSEFSGDGGPAAAASVYAPFALAVDAAGNLFIADASQRIRKVTPAGIISTVAGNGTLGAPNGDGGPATVARISAMDIAADAAGNLFLAEFARVRRVSAAGVITTIAGNGQSAFTQTGVPATATSIIASTVTVDSAGNVFFRSDYDGNVYRVSAAGTLSSLANRSSYGAGRIAADSSGNVLLADRGWSVVLRITPAGSVSTVAGFRAGGNGDGGPAAVATFEDMGGMAVDAAGNVFMADIGSHSVRKITPSGFISTVAGNGTLGSAGDGGPAVLANLWSPHGVAVDSSGNLYIADTSGNRIRKVTPSGIISTIAGTGEEGSSGDGGSATSARLALPSAIAVGPGGTLYFCDQNNNKIRRISALGIITTVAGTGVPGFSGDGGPATAATLNAPSAIALDAAGNIFIVDDLRVRMINAAGIISTVAGSGEQGLVNDAAFAASVRLYVPAGLAVDAQGNLYVSEDENQRVRKVTFTRAAVSYAVPDRGGNTYLSSGASRSGTTGYARLQPGSEGTTPVGIAIFGRRENGTLVSEASIPGAPAILSARIYAEVSGPVNTGVAIVNPNNAAVTISFFFTDASGDFGIGSMNLGANQQTAAFLDQAPFSGGNSINGSLTLNASLPVSIIALRTLLNERNEFLMTTLPVTDLGAATSFDAVVFPHVADGGSWTTQVILINPTNSTLSGAVQFFNPSGQPLVVSIDGTSGSSFPYSLPPRSSRKLKTSGASAQIGVGTVRAVPSPGHAAPAGLAVFSLRVNGILMTEAGALAAATGFAFRTYVEAAGTFGFPGAIVSG